MQVDMARKQQGPGARPTQAPMQLGILLVWVGQQWLCMTVASQQQMLKPDKVEKLFLESCRPEA